MRNDRRKDFVKRALLCALNERTSLCTVAADCVVGLPLFRRVLPAGIGGALMYLHQVKPERVGRMGRCVWCGEPTDWVLGDVHAHVRCAREITALVGRKFGTTLARASEKHACYHCGKPTNWLLAGAEFSHVNCLLEAITLLNGKAATPAYAGLAQRVAAAAAHTGYGGDNKPSNQLQGDEELIDGDFLAVLEANYSSDAVTKDDYVPGLTETLLANTEARAKAAPAPKAAERHAPISSTSERSRGGKVLQAPAAEVKPAQIVPVGEGGFSSPVMIADLGRLYFPGGKTVDLEQPVLHYGHLAELAQEHHVGFAERGKKRASRGLVLVTEALALEMGIPVENLPESSQLRLDAFLEAVDTENKGAHPVVAQAVADGWDVSRFGPRDSERERPASLQGTTRVWVPGVSDMAHPGYDITLISMASDVIQRASADLPSLADALSIYANHLGTTWRVSPSTSGFQLLESNVPWVHRQEVLHYYDPCVPAMAGNTEGELGWTRVPSEEEADRPYIHVYDRSGSYLTGMSGLEVPIGPAQHLEDEGLVFDPKVPGYWRVVLPEPLTDLLPNPVYKRQEQPGMEVWVTTPTLRLATDWNPNYTPEVLEAYVWPRRTVKEGEKKAPSLRVFDSWIRQVSSARTILKADPSPAAHVAMDLIKEMYTSTVGMMGSVEHKGKRKSPDFMPERRHFIIASARSNMLRRLAAIGEQTGQWPVAVAIDSVAYLSDDPDPISAFPGGPDLLGDALGRFHPEYTGRTKDHLPYLNGRTWTAKQLLTRVDKHGRPVPAEEEK